MQGGARRRSGRCAHTWAGPTRHRLRTMGWWLGLAPSTSKLAPDSSLEWAFAWFFDVGSALCFLNCAFCFIFHLYSNVCHAKHVSSNTSGTRLIVNACTKSLFIFSILDSNWRSNLIVSDHQQGQQYQVQHSRKKGNRRAIGRSPYPMSQAESCS